MMDRSLASHSHWLCHTVNNFYTKDLTVFCVVENIGNVKHYFISLNYISIIMLYMYVECKHSVSIEVRSGVKHCVSREVHSTHLSGPAGNTLQIGSFYTLILQTLMDALMSCSRSSGMSNSDRSRWKLTKQAIIRA